jgi:hypothetical protein
MTMDSEVLGRYMRTENKLHFAIYSLTHQQDVIIRRYFLQQNMNISVTVHMAVIKTMFITFCLSIPCCTGFLDSTFMTHNYTLCFGLTLQDSSTEISPDYRHINKLLHKYLEVVVHNCITRPITNVI